MKLPPPLAAGATVDVVAPSSPVADEALLAEGLRRLEALGYRPRLGQHATDGYGYLAGRDADRAEDLVGALSAEDGDAVVLLNGGYGAMRTLLALPDRLPGRLVHGPAKAVCGYSNNTVVHAFLRTTLGWASYHGPTVAALGHASDYTVRAFQTALTAPGGYEIRPAPGRPAWARLVPGGIAGEVVGGNLARVVSLLGTPWELDLDGKVLFFESVLEEPGTIDQLICQLLAAGRLQRCAAILIGEHYRCVPGVSGLWRQPSLSLGDVFADLLAPLGVPVVYGPPLGHGPHRATLLLGAHIEVPEDEEVIRVTRPAPGA